MTSPPPPSSTSSTFFTVNGGDIILRAGPDPSSKRDFRVHKVILSLASPVFADMFGLPQPSDQNQSAEHQLPIIEVTDPSEVLDKFLRLIYPGVEPLTIGDLPTLTALLSAADKYNVTSVYPILKDTLKTFLPLRPFGVYIVACRFGFSEEAKAAARVGSARSITHGDFSEVVQHISSTDILRWVQLVQEREIKGRQVIEWGLDWTLMDDNYSCEHGEAGRTFYFRLEKAVVDAFALNPSIESKDMFDVLDEVPDPPPACKSPPESGSFYRGGGGDDAFDCPFQPMTIRHFLVEIAQDLGDINRKMVDQAFRKGIGSS